MWQSTYCLSCLMILHSQYMHVLSSVSRATFEATRSVHHGLTAPYRHIPVRHCYCLLLICVISKSQRCQSHANMWSNRLLPNDINCGNYAIGPPKYVSVPYWLHNYMLHTDILKIQVTGVPASRVVLSNGYCQMM